MNAAELYRRVLGTWRNRRLERDLESEIAFHVAMETAKYERAGMSPAEARRRALLAFGAADRFREESRDVRGVGWLEAFARELRFSVRRLLHDRTFAVATIVVLALGIGAATAVLTLVDTVLLRPLPYPSAERLVVIAHTAPGLGIASAGQSDGTLAYYRAHARTLEHVGAYLENEISITDGDAAERVHIAMIDPAVLQLVLPRALHGRLFTSADRDGRYIMISHELWQRRYGGDPAIVGGTIETNRTPDVVVGVMPPGFDFPRPETDVWMAMQPEEQPTRADIQDLYYTGIARLRPGVSAADAERELTQLVRRLPEQYADVSAAELDAAQLRPTVRTLHEAATAGVRRSLRLLLVLIGVVLVIAWANAANLVVLRAERQRRQLAVARVLGARGSDVLRRFLIENSLIALCAGSLGAALAAFAVSARFGFEPHALPRLHELAVGGRIFAAAAVLALVTAALLTLAAQLRAGSGRMEEALHHASARVTPGRGTQRVQAGLVGVQVALAFVLLVCSAAMVRSLWSLQRTELGFDAAALVSFEVNPPARPYLSYGSAATLHAGIRDAIDAIPGVTGVEAARALPLQPDLFDLREAVVVDGAPAATAVSASVNLVTPGYFNALGIPLLRGRTFGRPDLEAESPGVVISSTLARTLFESTAAVGRRIRLSASQSAPAFTIIGVAGDVASDRIEAGSTPTLYLPAIFDATLGTDYATPIRYVPRELTIIVRTTLDPAALAGPVRRAMGDVDGKIPVVRMQTLRAAVERATLRMRLVTALLVTAAVAALFLGAVGLWGVVAYTLERRAPELAIRLAVGANVQQILRTALGSAVSITAAGLAGGAVAAYIVTRGMEALLFEAQPMDVAGSAAVAMLLVAVALAACIAPARRALRIDPASLLRSD